MRFVETSIEGVLVVEPEPVGDDRGTFVRTFCTEEFELAGLDPRVTQCSVSVNARPGTLRGMHWQCEPYAEAKLVRCSRGRIFDVAVDVRVGSPTFGQWFGLELDSLSFRALYLPPGAAHGFITLEPETEVSYQISVKYEPDAARGFRFDDPDVAIEWPMKPAVVSDRDLALPAFSFIRRVN